MFQPALRKRCFRQGRLLDKRHLLDRGVYLKMLISEGRLSDTRRLLEGGRLNDHLR